MRVLITGVSGFVGTHLARFLAAQGHQVSGTYIRGAPDLDGVELFDVDLLDPPGLARVVADSQPEVIVHLAGLSHVGDSFSRPVDYFQINVLGTENLQKAAPGIRLIAASSAEVYGAVPEADQPIAESRLPAPQSPYALTKAAMERLVLARGAVIVRSFNIVGPGQLPTFALPAFALQLAAIGARRQEPILKVGNLSARRDFVHVDDAVGAYERLLTDAEEGGIYNLGSGEPFSIEEALARLIEISGVSPEVEVDPDRCRPIDLPLLQADNRRLQKLGWVRSKNLNDALRDLWRWTLQRFQAEAVSRSSPNA